MAEQRTIVVISEKAAHLELEVLVTVHVHMCMCVCVYTCHVLAYTCASMCGRHLPQPLPALFSEMGSISEPAFSDMHRLANQQSLPLRGLSSAGFTDMCDHAQLFTQVLHA